MMPMEGTHVGEGIPSVFNVGKGYKWSLAQLAQIVKFLEKSCKNR